METFLTNSIQMRIQLLGAWSLWRLIRLFLIAYATLCLYGLLLSERQIFRPPEPTYLADGTSGFELLKIPVGIPASSSASSEEQANEAQESIAAFFLPHPTSRRVMLYSHGNAEDLGTVRAIAAVIQQSGYSVLAYDYRGYGLSDGDRPSERKAYQDIEAAYRYLVETLDIAPEDIFVHGRSVGGGPSVYLAATWPVGGLIIESSFVSTFRVMTRVQIVPFDKFPSLKRLKDVTCPVLVIHGTADEVIPFWHGEKLYEAVRGAKRSYWVEGAGHNDLAALEGDRYVEALRSFGEWVESQ